MIDTMIRDGLWDAFNGYHMGTTAENVAREFQITRKEQDEFAVRSQNKTEAAHDAGTFKEEIVPVTLKTRKGEVVVDKVVGIEAREQELERIRQAVAYGHGLGLQVNAGHGLHYHNVRPIVAIPHIAELNIGHAIIAEAVFIGLEQAVKKMKALLVP